MDEMLRWWEWSEENHQTGLNWQESIVTQTLTGNTLNIEVDGLQQQKTKSGFIPVRQQQES